MCVCVYVCMCVSGRAEGGGVDGCVPGGNHGGWLPVCHHPISGEAGRRGGHLERCRRGGATRPLGVSLV